MCVLRACYVTSRVFMESLSCAWYLGAWRITHGAQIHKAMRMCIDLVVSQSVNLFQELKLSKFLKFRQLA